MIQKKVCSKCDIEMPVSDFHKCKGGRFGVRSDCKFCSIARVKAHAAKKADHIKDYKRRYREENQDRVKSYAAEWRDKNRSHISAYAASHGKIRLTERAAGQAKRRARKLNATPPWYGELDEFVMREAADLCRLRELATGFAWQVDHMVPLQAKLACGLHCAANVQVIPAALNTAKLNRLIMTEPLEWLSRG